jgi:hypothetical protein
MKRLVRGTLERGRHFLDFNLAAHWFSRIDQGESSFSISCADKYSLANVVLPAPFGPATIRMFGTQGPYAGEWDGLCIMFPDFVGLNPAVPAARRACLGPAPRRQRPGRVRERIARDIPKCTAVAKAAAIKFD